MKLPFEFLLVLSIGALFSFVGNLISPVGLDLGKDYFPKSIPTESSVPSDGTGQGEATQVGKHEFGTVSMEELKQMLASPKFSEGTYMLLDARDDAHYREDHITGAIQFYHFRPERTLEQVVLGSQKAERIVIYCNGGTCEDSHYAARLLVDLGVNRDAIVIYDGGIKEWKEAGLPVGSQ